MPRSDRRRAVTLVELMVALGVGVGVLAVLLTTFDQTRRLASREIQRNALRQEATVAIHRAATALSAAVPASAVDLFGTVPEVFGPNEIQVLTWNGAEGDVLPFVTVGAENRVAVSFQYRTLPTGEWRNSLPAGEFPILVRVTATAMAAIGEGIEPVEIQTTVATAAGGAS